MKCNCIRSIPNSFSGACEICGLFPQQTFIKVDNVDGEWLSPVPTERAWQEEKLVEIFGHYPTASPRWQYMNGLIQNSLDAKQMYSEEEVLDLLYKRDLYLINRDEEIDLELPDKWFEQFKKNSMKQETLEEAAERIYPVVIKPILDVYDDGVSNQIGEEDINKDSRESFIAGVKWQQEQDKNKYNEEDMIEFAVWMYLEVGSNKGKERTNKELFEQFKKEIKE
jgi:hypothetical protein